ncbi:MAG: cupredoxin domain-containing protein, partial [Actinobacteria bacterium]|nr:cupredoxin domain-containing protein [Actinomycetota bacterium]
MTRFAAVALLLATSCVSAVAAGPRTIEVSMHYSHYSVSSLDVAAGSTVTFLVHNTDPIPHEFIIGTEAEQAAHETGARRSHNGLPGQASVEPGARATVVYTFARAGTFIFACHLPGHYAYGMRGTVTVR